MNRANPVPLKPIASPESMMELHLVIKDAELCEQLEAHEDGRIRHDFAVTALRIGTLALRQAQGHIDADRIRSETDHLIDLLKSTLTDSQGQMTQQIRATLKEYFDPTDGRFNERVENLLKDGGELERFLADHVGADGSVLAKTLSEFLGGDSPLLKTLDPENSEGVIACLTETVNRSAEDQRARILREFSLDNKEGALSRLVAELTDRHGKTGEELQKKIDEVVGEFSLDNEDSALSRLVGRVEKAQQLISAEFSLDEQGSALSRLRREVLNVLEDERKSNSEFREQVLKSLTEMIARKEEAARSTRHGREFQDEVFRFIQDRSQRAGDIATDTGNTTGKIRHCKKGDIVIELGPEHAAAGSRIVIEAKEQQGYDLAAARKELEQARKNRAAEVGLFVFSSKIAPEGLQTLGRFGNDVVVVWDAEDPAMDVTLIAGLEVARCLCARAHAERLASEVDFEAIDEAILEIEKQVKGLDEIIRMTGTIKGNSKKILHRAETMKEAISRKIGILREDVDDLKTSTGGDVAVDA